MRACSRLFPFLQPGEIRGEDDGTDAVANGDGDEVVHEERGLRSARQCLGNEATVGVVARQCLGNVATVGVVGKEAVEQAWLARWGLAWRSLAYWW